MKSKREQSQTILSLPREIISNILSRLPAKCLGQCKCVCKYYYSLISNEEFAKLHLNQAKSDMVQTRIFTVCPFYSLDFESDYGFDDVDDSSAYQGVQELSPPSAQSPEVDQNNGGEVEFVGSCNGLICLNYITPTNFILWNPTTRESRAVPDHTTSFEYLNLIFYGFGYSPSEDDYKLVTCVSQNISRTLVVEVFNLKFGSWTKINHKLDSVAIWPVRSSGEVPEVGIYLNGVLHWESTRGVEPHKSKYFITLNLGGDEYDFGELLEPKVADESIVFRSLGMINGCISLLSDENYDELGIWVMKEYGVRGSWSRIALLDLYDFSCCYVIPLCFAKNGEMIIDIDGERLVRYNIKDRSLRYLQNGCAPHFVYALYVESLISPNSQYTMNRQIQMPN